MESVLLELCPIESSQAFGCALWLAPLAQLLHECSTVHIKSNHCLQGHLIWYAVRDEVHETLS